MIQVLRSGLSRPELLESRYGSALPSKPLKALQRDALLINNHTHQDDVYDKPMAEVFHAYLVTNNNNNNNIAHEYDSCTFDLGNSLTLLLVK